MNIHAFVNGNRPNVHFSVDESTPQDMVWDTLPARFAAMVKHDEVNHDADVVLVYVCDGEFVAWYDIENGSGFIA
jgi:hypothetical protein